MLSSHDHILSYNEGYWRSTLPSTDNILTLFDIHVHDIVIKSQDCCLMLCGLIIYFGFAIGMFISSFQMGE